MTENNRLRRFAMSMFHLSDWPDGGDIDGCDFQDAAVDCELLEETTQYERCGAFDACKCSEIFSDEEFKAGVTCYRKTALLRSILEATDESE